MDDEKLLGLLRNEKHVIIYGAGRVAKTVAEYFIHRELGIHIDCFAVSSMKGNDHFIYGKKVIEVNQMDGYAKNTAILIATREEYQKEISQLLRENNYFNIFFITDRLFQDLESSLAGKKLASDNGELFKARLKNLFFLTLEDVCREQGMSDKEIESMITNEIKQDSNTSVSINRLVVVLGSKCSLSCRDCNNLMPRFKPQTDIPLSNILGPLELLLNKMHTILRCELIGGEPFLSENLENVLDYVVAQENIKSIEITTNATVIPAQSVLEKMRDKKVKIRISDYGAMVDKSKLIAVLEQEDIRYELLQLGLWTAPGGVERRNRCKSELKRIYQQCPSSMYCKTLYDGKIFSCARASSLYALGYMQEDEYLEVSPGLSAQDLNAFINRTSSIACDYCDVAIDKPIYVQPAVQNGKQEI